MIRKWCRSRLASAAFVLSVALLPAKVGAAQDAIQPLPADGILYGMKLADWGAAWFQWRYSLPNGVNPDVLVDERGEWAGIGQRAPVWFLPIFGVGRATRTITVPEGQAILAVVGWQFYQAPPGESTEAQLLARGRGMSSVLDQVARSATAALDGVTITDLKRYRVVTPVFTITLPPDNLLGVPVTPGEDARVAAVGAGHVLLFPPLPVGRHVYTVRDEGFGVDYTIHLIIQKPNVPLP